MKPILLSLTVTLSLAAMANAQATEPGFRDASELEALLERQIEERGTVEKATPSTGGSAFSQPGAGTLGGTTQQIQSGVVDPRPVEPDPAPQDYQPVRAEVQIALPIQFDYDSDELRPTEFTQLLELCTALTRLPEVAVEIIGHTDTAGGEDYNLELSERRASSVMAFLRDTCGIEPARLASQGQGERYPLDGIDGPSAANRRVEIQVAGTL